MREGLTGCGDRIGEQKFSSLGFASSTHNVASEVMESFRVFVQIQY